MPEPDKRRKGKRKSENANGRLYVNKLYHTPATPSPNKLTKRERGFILDGVAVRNISDDFCHANPKLGTSLPVYNAQKDPYAAHYFKVPSVRAVLAKTGQKPPGTAVDGVAVTRAAEHGAPGQYLRRRNMNGCGRSAVIAGGHTYQNYVVVSMDSYNGKFGYRRNTPWLRNTPSCFGVVTDLPLH